MKLFDVYPLYAVTPVRGEDVFVYDQNGQGYLDLYGGHAVICLLYTSPSPRDATLSRMPSSA